jgi:hypothetical protein
MSRIFRIFSLALSLAFLASFAVFSLAPRQAAAAGSCKVGIYGAADAARLADVQSKLNSTGLFSQVDVHDVRSYTPTLAELQQYSAVLVFSNNSFIDSTAMGNVLADYADADGGVVVATFAFNDATINIAGRIVSDGYLPFTQAAQVSGTQLTLIPDVTAHPILANVSSFDGGSNSYHETISLTAGAFQIAHWSNDIPLVATKQPTSGKIVGLNFYPPSSDYLAGNWVAATDGARLMGNALAWAGNCITTDTKGVVGIYGAVGALNLARLTDIQIKLNGTGLFARIDIHDAGAYTPSLGELQQYSAVFVFGDAPIFDRIALGDVLANYSDAGRGVVVTAFSYTTGFTCDIQGRILTGGYLPFTTGGFTQNTLLTLIPDLPSHPILAGVNSFDGGTSSYCGTISLTVGATQVAHWSNDVPLVATKKPSAGKIVGLNFYPPSSDARVDFWTATTDGARLMGNSLTWAACIDNDGDGYGINCLAGSDCNDNDAAIHPGATEVCNGKDDDCDGQTDEGGTTAYYRDKDGDGYGDADNATQACTAPAGYVSDNSDVDDADAFYTDILPTCAVKIIPGVLGRFIGDKDKNRTLLVIGARGTEFGDNATIKWDSDAIEVLSTRVLFKRFMFMRATFNGEPLEWKEYRVLIGDCEGMIRWAR